MLASPNSEPYRIAEQTLPAEKWHFQWGSKSEVTRAPIKMSRTAAAENGGFSDVVTVAK